VKRATTRGLRWAALALFGVSSAQTKVGILLWNTQPRYQRCKDGVIEQLRQEGFAEPQVSRRYPARSRQATCQRTRDILFYQRLNLILDCAGASGRSPATPALPESARF
jgi:hypothetical protein